MHAKAPQFSDVDGVSDDTWFKTHLIRDLSVHFSVAFTVLPHGIPRSLPTTTHCPLAIMNFEPSWGEEKAYTDSTHFLGPDLYLLSIHPFHSRIPESAGAALDDSPSTLGPALTIRPGPKQGV